MNIENIIGAYEKKLRKKDKLLLENNQQLGFVIEDNSLHVLLNVDGSIEYYKTTDNGLIRDIISDFYILYNKESKTYLNCKRLRELFYSAFDKLCSNVRPAHKIISMRSDINNYIELVVKDDVFEFLGICLCNNDIIQYDKLPLKINPEDIVSIFEINFLCCRYNFEQCFNNIRAYKTYMYHLFKSIYKTYEMACIKGDMVCLLPKNNNPRFYCFSNVSAKYRINSYPRSISSFNFKTSTNFWYGGPNSVVLQHHLWFTKSLEEHYKLKDTLKAATLLYNMEK